ncbi:MAG TPA: SpoVG family protein [Fibrobacteraceae bacterium]|jgi:stage V sporulation protein G|nr:SpoVG family protein [Fibrobacteraceae bacterium]HPW95059.1 SpoVG family protein [Fibrobacteraceae bacterium]
MAKTKAEKKEMMIVKESEPHQVVQFDCLAVTNVNVFPFKEGPTLGKTKAIASVVLNDQLQLTNLRVMDGVNGLFVSYPNDPFYKGEDFRTIYHPVTRQCREHIENCVLEKYQEAISA